MVGTGGGVWGGAQSESERDFCSLVRNDFPLLPATPSRRAPRLQEPWILNIHAGGILPCVGGSGVCRDRRECVKYRSLLLLSLFALCLAAQPNSREKKKREKKDTERGLRLQGARMQPAEADLSRDHRTVFFFSFFFPMCQF